MNADAVIEKLKRALHLETDQALADFFGVTRPNVANWRTRNTLNHSLVLDRCPGLSLDWLYKDEGEPFLSTAEGRRLRAGRSIPSSHFIRSSEPSEDGMLEFFEYLKEKYKLNTRWENLEDVARENVRINYQLMVSELHAVEAQYAQKIVSAILTKEKAK